METTKVDGKDKGRLLLYALSTCVWCKKMKAFLDEQGVSYEFIFVDMLDADDRKSVMEELRKFNPRGSFPTLVINEENAVVGFNRTKLSEAIGE